MGKSSFSMLISLYKTLILISLVFSPIFLKKFHIDHHPLEEFPFRQDTADYPIFIPPVSNSPFILVR